MGRDPTRAQGIAMAAIERKKGNPGGSGYDRDPDDWYVEPPWIVRALFEAEPFPRGMIWDPACGRGTIPTVAAECGLFCAASDKVDRGFPTAQVLDFLQFDGRAAHAIVSNPPYAILRRFVDRALEVSNGHVAILARLAFLEGIGRREWFMRTGLSRVLVSAGRVSCPPGHQAPPIGGPWPKGGKTAYAWFIWRPGYTGDPTLGFLPPPPK